MDYNKLYVLTCCVALVGGTMLSGCKGGEDSAAPGNGTNTAVKDNAGKGDFKDIVLTDDENGTESKTSFGKDTAVIYCNTKLENVPSGSKVRGVWICEKSAVSEPNFKIAEKTLDIGALINTAKFSLSKPTAGWPVGDYRVELYVGDQLKQTVKFKVA